MSDNKPMCEERARALLLTCDGRGVEAKKVALQYLLDEAHRKGYAKALGVGQNRPVPVREEYTEW